MRNHAIGAATLLALLIPLTGCQRQDEATNPGPAASVVDTAPAPREVRDIVFRAKYYRSKECVHMPNGDYALMLVYEYSVVEVVQGELHMKRLALLR